jgi:hypothetical protein
MEASASHDYHMKRRRREIILAVIRQESPNLGPIAKEHIMTSVTKIVSRMAVVVGMTTFLLSGAVAPALANSNDGGPFYYEPSDNGSVWSNYSGYTTGRTLQRHGHDSSSYRARAQAPGFNPGQNVVVDDPPGSAFQTEKNDEAMGCPC